jgi:uncharacterized peroxidase-related enzyme
MSRINQISPDSATDKAKGLLDAVKSKLGLVPNMMRAMANAPAALEGYLGLSGSLGKGTLPARVREQLALAIGEANHCDYCVSAHSTIGKSLGLTAEQVRDSRQGHAIDTKTDALLKFARKIVAARGQVGVGDLNAVREAGWDDAAIVEVVAHVALNTFTNYFNNVVDTDIDFPRAEKLVTAEKACASGACPL